jgi:hypothetical protein
VNTTTDLVIPDLTMRGMDDPHGRAAGGEPSLTVGRLATRIHALAARPADWWHLVIFEPDQVVRVRVETEPADAAHPIEIWLTTWPPGHRTRVHGHGGGTTKATVVIAGELVEVALTGQGATERPLRANRVRVHGGGHLHELANPGPAFAITLHAEHSGGAPDRRARPLSDAESG